MPSKHIGLFAVDQVSHCFNPGWIFDGVQPSPFRSPCGHDCECSARCLRSGRDHARVHDHARERGRARGHGCGRGGAYRARAGLGAGRQRAPDPARRSKLMIF